MHPSFTAFLTTKLDLRNPQRYIHRPLPPIKLLWRLIPISLPRSPSMPLPIQVLGDYSPVDLRIEGFEPLREPPSHEHCSMPEVSLMREDGGGRGRGKRDVHKQPPMREDCSDYCQCSNHGEHVHRSVSLRKATSCQLWADRRLRLGKQHLVPCGWGGEVDVAPSIAGLLRRSYIGARLM